jgi:hypothetical protein
MKKKDRELSKLYDRLTLDERVRLVIQAKARGDAEDTQRLTESCPTKTYTKTAIAFGDQISGSWKMTMMLCRLLAPSLARHHTIAAVREVLTYALDHCISGARLAYLRGYEMGVRRAWEAAGKKGDPPTRLWKEEAQEENPVMKADLGDLHAITGRLREAIADLLLGQLEELERRTASEALAVWKAFGNFCNDKLQLEPETLVEAWLESMLPEIEELVNLPEPPEVDPDEVEHLSTELKRVWSELVGSD